MRSPGDVVIGLDLGTSSLKAIALDLHGDVVGAGSASYPTHRPESGAAEQSPDDWLAALGAVISQLAAQVPQARWAAIGLSAMLPTLVCVTRAGEAFGPAITWEDGRAEPEAATLLETIGEDSSYRITGQRVDGRYLLPMFARQQRTLDPGDDVTVMGAKDYLFLYLTGEELTDPSTATGFGCYDLTSGRWDESILAAARSPRVPTIAPSSEARPLLADIAAAFGCQVGIPVVLGAADSVLGALGLGVTSGGRVAYIAGTSTVILGHSETARLDPHRRYIVTPMAAGGFGLEMDLMATGAAYSWLAETLGLAGGGSELSALAETATAGEHPTFLPYVTPGEQGALWNPDLTGTLHGLTMTTGREQVARSVFTGIIVESRRCLALLESAVDAGAVPPGPIVVSGASASSPWFIRDLADATGRPVSRRRGSISHSAIGAGMLAARSVLDCEIASSEALDLVEPDPREAARWEDISAGQEALRTRLYG